MATQEEVRLVVPATPEFLRLARVTATGLASRLGFSYDDVEDLRLAIDELCFALIGSKGKEGTVTLRYAMPEGALEIEGSGRFAGDQADAAAPPTLSDLSKQILGALVDEYRVYMGDGGLPSFHLRKKRPGTV
ncbi:MAG TPA: ATP-binding protein [Acidimicrobiales bacterium]|nr:ATP-binding protein [Acidimicrobiales bacterium]